MSKLRAFLALLDSPAGIFGVGWTLVVGGLALRSWSTALVTGGALFLAVVLVGAKKKA